MGFTIGILNLWLPFLLGYGLVWLSASLSSRGIRQEPDSGQADEYLNKKLMYLFGFYPFLGLVTASIFIPLKFGLLFWPGLIVFTLGIALNIITVRTFIRSSQSLKTVGPYRYSRNPMYVANLIYILGLNLMGWAQSWANVLFILLSLYWMGGTHWCVLREEVHLAKKFGQDYLNYKMKTPRYWLF